MYNEDFRQIIRDQYENFGSYNEVARVFEISANTVRNIVLDLGAKNKEKRGPKSKLTSLDLRKIARASRRISGRGERVTSRKIKQECSLNQVCERTIERALKSMGQT